MPVESTTRGLTIGFSTMSYQIKQELLLYPPFSLFGDIGGSLGLFLGFSLLAFGETILELGKKIFDGCKKKQKSSIPFMMKQ